MANISTKRHATIELSEKDWDMIKGVYNLIDNIKCELEDVGLELDSPEVYFNDFGKEYSVGELFQSIYYAIDELYCEKSGLC